MQNIFANNLKVYFTIFNYAELLRGAYISKNVALNIRLVNEFVKRFTVIGFEVISVDLYSKIYAELRHIGQTIGDFDELIASIVIQYNGKLYTHNSVHLERISLLDYEDWFPEVSK